MEWTRNNRAKKIFWLVFGPVVWAIYIYIYIFVASELGFGGLYCCLCIILLDIMKIVATL